MANHRRMNEKKVQNQMSCKGLNELNSKTHMFIFALFCLLVECVWSSEPHISNGNVHANMFVHRVRNHMKKEKCIIHHSKRVTTAKCMKREKKRTLK